MTDSTRFASPSGYAAPRTLEEALTLLSADSANRVIAGGTDLIPGVRAGLLRPGMLVDVRHLPLGHIVVELDRVRLGAGVAFADLLESPVLDEEYPALVEAATEVGGPPIRNRATLGGNLANASPAADGAPPLLVYDASVVLAARDDRREVPLESFFQGPGQTVLRPGEILLEIRLDRPRGPASSAFVKLGPRNAMAVSIVSVAVRIDPDDSGGVRQCRIALGAVAPTPIRAQDAEGVIVSRGLGADAVAQAAAVAAQTAAPIDDIRATADYRRRMVRVLVGRMLARVAAQLGRGEAHG